MSSVAGRTSSRRRGALGRNCHHCTRNDLAQPVGTARASSRPERARGADEWAPIAPEASRACRSSETPWHRTFAWRAPLLEASGARYRRATSQAATSPMLRRRSCASRASARRSAGPRRQSSGRRAEAAARAGRRSKIFAGSSHRRSNARRRSAAPRARRPRAIAAGAKRRRRNRYPQARRWPGGSVQLAARARPQRYRAAAFRRRQAPRPRDARPAQAETERHGARGPAQPRRRGSASSAPALAGGRRPLPQLQREAAGPEAAPKRQAPRRRQVHRHRPL